MKIKRIATFVLAIATVFCTSVSAMAVDVTPESNQAAKVSAAKELAYMDIESASSELKAEILEARNVIIFNETWVADGYEATITEPDGTTYKAPHFSDLFPGWDLPVVASPKTALHQSRASSSGTVTTFLKNPTSVNSNPFLTAYGYEESLYLKVQELENGGTCNIGFTNDLTGESVGVFTRKAVGSSVGLDAVPGEAAYVSVRGSTYDEPGDGTFYYDYW